MNTTSTASPTLMLNHPNLGQDADIEGNYATMSADAFTAFVKAMATGHHDSSTSWGNQSFGGKSVNTGDTKLLVGRSGATENIHGEGSASSGFTSWAPDGFFTMSDDTGTTIDENVAPTDTLILPPDGQPQLVLDTLVASVGYKHGDMTIDVFKDGSVSTGSNTTNLSVSKSTTVAGVEFPDGSVLPFAIVGQSLMVKGSATSANTYQTPDGFTTKFTSTNALALNESANGPISDSGIAAGTDAVARLLETGSYNPQGVVQTVAGQQLPLLASGGNASSLASVMNDHAGLSLVPNTAYMKG